MTRAAGSGRRRAPVSSKRNVAVWIDHRKAILAIVTGRTEAVEHVTSHVQEHGRYSGAAQEDAAENQRDRRYANHLDRYYDEVITHLRTADSILVVGPGEAKTELQARLRQDALDGRVVGVEAVDKMTDRQIAALARNRFAAGAPQ